MHNTNKNAYSDALHYINDIAIICIAYVLSYVITSLFVPLLPMRSYIWLCIFFVPLWLFSMSRKGMYEYTTFKYIDRVVRNIVYSAALAVFFTTSMVFFLKANCISKELMLVYFGIATLLLAFSHLFILYRNRINPNYNVKNIMIVGENKYTKKLLYFLNKTNLKTNIIAIATMEEIEEMINVAKERAVDEVYFTVSTERVHLIKPHVHFFEEMGITVNIAVNLFQMNSARAFSSAIGTVPVVVCHSVCLNQHQLFVKRVIDIVGALVGIAITALLSIIIVPMIKLDSKGPILFKQNRVGVNGRIFQLYKFRSMTVDAEQKKAELAAQNEMSGGMFKMKNDPRVTRVGKFLRATSLDEFPQFLNVLKGDMSLVGTRPPTVDEVAGYQNWHRKRISIKPGITGMWQVSGRSEITDFDEIVGLDIQYIRNWNFFLDIKILFKTVWVMLARKGAM